MYYIVVYDITNKKRLPKVLKTCRRYLDWTQYSVFEGELSESQYQSLVVELYKIIDDEKDSIIFYSLSEKWLRREVVGIDKNPRDNIL
jgi:CRISPR-associated protein Cas2